ncbi:helix-turn-helix domain-containing protein [Pantanalinema sp. GBBB05]|uniref:helix-turn-helix domain-containing protein n=1 Tax=Pantanalinema sp. GBBB05 TaxID=2604139 RepID=UPI001DB141C6|nr:transcriptional regulator [Pantanalinema sp. GBBB05]
MTIGLKTPSAYYLELINTFPPRPITNEAGLIATQNRINQILDQANLTQDDRDYLHVLGMLVYDYEEQYEAMSKLAGVDLIKALMAESQLQANDLVPVLGQEAVVSKVLNKEQPLTNRKKTDLATFFQILAEFFS